MGDAMPARTRLLLSLTAAAALAVPCAPPAHAQAGQKPFRFDPVQQKETLQPVAQPGGKSAPQRLPAGAAPPTFSVEEKNVLEGERLFGEARALTGNRQYGQAAERLKRLIRLPFPPDPAARELMAGAHASLAEVLLLQRNYREADAVARKGLGYAGSDQKPSYLRGDLYELLGRISQNQGDRAGAEENLRRAMQFRGQSPR